MLRACHAARKPHDSQIGVEAVGDEKRSGDHGAHHREGVLGRVWCHRHNRTWRDDTHSSGRAHHPPLVLDRQSLSGLLLLDTKRFERIGGSACAQRVLPLRSSLGGAGLEGKSPGDAETGKGNASSTTRDDILSHLQAHHDGNDRRGGIRDAEKWLLALRSALALPRLSGCGPHRVPVVPAKWPSPCGRRDRWASGQRISKSPEKFPPLSDRND